jgi:hypothetical protein
VKSEAQPQGVEPVSNGQHRAGLSQGIAALSSRPAAPGVGGVNAGVAAAYFVLTVVLTWPISAGLGRDVPGDLGDSLLNMWILGWGTEHIPRLLTGSIGWQQFWHGNIFHPEPYTLALSEHLFAQALQVLPVYWLSGNLILCYNLVFLSTFFLSAFGMYLLVRDLTGDWRAAFLAGLVYGFLPYRIAQIPHVQVLSSQWMPFALVGFHRFVVHRSRRALVLGTGALVLQNWSCGYYLLYFAVVLPFCLVYWMWSAGSLRDRRRWIGLAAAAAVTLALSYPFLTPYLEAQILFGFERPLGEVLFFSANVWSYITSSEWLRLLGSALRFFPRAEGETFLGFVPMLLTAAGLIHLAISTRRPGPAGGSVRGWRRVLTILLAIAAAAQFASLVSVVLWGGFNMALGPVTIRATTGARLLGQLIIVVAAWLAVSPAARCHAARMAKSPLAFFAAMTLLAMWLSLGPVPRTAGGDVPIAGTSLYDWLYANVPGFTGVRVPARYAMIAGLFLAIAAGYAGAALLRFPFGPAAVSAAGVLFVVESAAMPLAVNFTWGQHERMPPSRVLPSAEAPAVYRRLAEMPARTVVAEFPFGDTAWEIRYVYYSTVHWKPILNGYSGSSPPGYSRRLARIRRVSDRPDDAWAALISAGATHVVLHIPAFVNAAEAAGAHVWLEAHGARRVESFPEGDVLYSLPDAH